MANARSFFEDASIVMEDAKANLRGYRSLRFTGVEYWKGINCEAFLVIQNFEIYFKHGVRHVPVLNSLLDTFNGSYFFFRSCTEITCKVSLTSTSLLVSILHVYLQGDDLFCVRLENDFFRQFDFNA
jgi:hypothetical protein